MRILIISKLPHSSPKLLSPVIKLLETLLKFVGAVSLTCNRTPIALIIDSLPSASHRSHCHPGDCPLPRFQAAGSASVSK